MCFTARIIFFSAISNSDLATLWLLQNIAGAKFCWLCEFRVAAVLFLVCLCMLRYYFVLATCALCVSLCA